MRYRPFCIQIYVIFSALTLTSYSAPASTPHGTIAPRQNSPDERVCERITPNSAMANVGDAYALVDYLSARSGADCRHDRNNAHPYNNFIQIGTAQANIYFTDRNPQVQWATYDCGKIATYLRELIDACRTPEGKVQGRRMIPNCPNKEIGYLGAVPMNDGGSAIEVVPAGYRS